MGEAKFYGVLKGSQVGLSLRSIHMDLGIPMKDLRQRTDDVSDLERSVNNMQWDMTEVKNTLKSFTEAQMTRDRKLDDMLASLTTKFIEKEKKTEEDISNMEKRLGNQITSLDQRLSLIERGSGGAGHIQTGVTQGGWGPTPTDLKAVIHGFKQEAKEQEVNRIVAKILSETGMKEKHWIDYPAIPLTHVFVECEDKRIRDRFVRSASMRKYEMEDRTIRISEALEPEQRFEKKRLGYIKLAINKSTGIHLHWIKLNLETRSVFVNGQLVTRVENDGLLKYYKYEDIEKEVQELMNKMVDKKLVAATVRSRELGMQRRINQMTTSSQFEME